MKPKSTNLIILTFLVACALGAVAQEPAEKADAPESPKADSAKKLALKDAVRVSTDDALANVVRQKATNKDANTKTPSR